MRILIKYPTRGRPELFKKAIENITSSIGSGDYFFLITLDDDDETMKTEDVKQILNKHKHIYGKSHNKIDAVNRDMITAGKWDILVQISDDMFFTKNNWGNIIRDKVQKDFNNSLDFYLHFNDGFVGQRCNTMQIMGRHYFERTGTIYNPIYKTIYCDAEAMYVAIMLGRYKYYEEGIFEHRHPANGFKNNDTLYDINCKGSDEDKSIYECRRTYLFNVKPEIIPADLQPYYKARVS